MLYFENIVFMVCSGFIEFCFCYKYFFEYNLCRLHIVLIAIFEEGNSVKSYIEKRAVEIAEFIVKSNATVRETAKKFGISKSTVHTDVN